MTCGNAGPVRPGRGGTLAARGVEVDHVTVYRWVQRFSPLLAEAARFCRHSPGDRWFVHETYVKVNGVWSYVYRAVDQYERVIDVLVAVRRDAAAARRFFRRALATLKVTPAEVVTDAAAVYPAVLDELIPSAWHHVERYANSRIEADHSRMGRCAVYELTEPPASSSPDTPSCRTYGAATMKSDWRLRPPCGSQPRSPNSLERSDQTPRRRIQPANATTQRSLAA